MDLPKLWAQIGADLEQARSTLPNDTDNDKAIRQYEEFLSHNQLELASDMLEFYAKGHTVNKEFWLALRDAAQKWSCTTERVDTRSLPTLPKPLPS